MNVGITRAKSAVLVMYHFEANMILSTVSFGTLRSIRVHLASS